jgi:hypothetical protein
MPDDPILETGHHLIRATCPTCSVVELVAVLLTPVLTVPEGDEATLKVQAKSRPVPHRCGSPSTLDLGGEG